jgi:type I restriction enzyme M protein
MSSQTSGEGEMRQRMIENDAVDCMVALPGQMFYSTQIPVCLWFLARDKSANGHRDRRGETLFIDARNMGYMVNRTTRAFDDDDLKKITDAYHSWRAKPESLEELGLATYEDQAGFCKSASREDIEKNGFVLTPGRYVGAEDAEDDGVPFEEKFAALREALEGHFSKSIEIQNEILSWVGRTE